MKVYKTNRNNTELHYEYLRSNAETDETVILLHGNGLDSRSWYKIIDGLLEHYNVLMYDFPGYGMSPLKSNLPSWEELCTDFKLLTEYLGLQHYHLIGHDVGGNLAIILANEYPNQVKTIILISTPCFFPIEETRKYIDFRKRLVNEFGKERLISNLIPKITLHNEDKEWEVVRNGLEASALEMHFHLCHLVAETDWITRLKKISHPVLVLSGERDSLFTPYTSRVASGFIMNSEYINILEASNMVFIDQPQETLRHITRFLVNADNYLLTTQLDSFDELEQIQIKMKEKFKKSHFSIEVSRINFKLLGEFSIHINDLKIEHGWNKRNAKNLILYLTFYRKVSREQLCDDLWPDKNIVSVQNQLRVSLNYLKGLLSQNGFSDILKSDREYIRLDVSVHSDIYELYRILVNENFEENRINLETVIFRYSDVIYDNNYLMGFSDEWSVKLKQYIAIRMQYWAERLAEYHENEGNRYMATSFYEIHKRL